MTDPTTEERQRALPAGTTPPERIEIDEFLLRRPSLADDADVRAINDAVVAGFAEIHPWMPWCTEPVNIDEQRAWIESTPGNWETAEAFNYLLVDADGRVAGSISLMDRVGPGALEIGYWIRTDATGRGYVSRAAARLTEIALGMPGIDRVEIHCDAANVRSAAVPRRLGFRLAREEQNTITAPGESGVEQYWVTP